MAEAQPPDDSPQQALVEAAESRKRKREDGTAAPDEEEGGAAAGDAAAKPDLRFRVGQQVLCNLSKKAYGFLWRRATVFALRHEAGGSEVTYVVQLEDGKMAGSPVDHDECIRLAARATLDSRVMRVFALPADQRASAHPRFMEGDRVAVQLDVGIWEEGTVLEVWACPERGGKPLKSWVGFAVPYAVRLDMGEDVMVPFDTDEVIRAESAARPPQKSIAEQLGGKDRTAAEPKGKRFVKRKNATGQWVTVDNVTGSERPCCPPDSDEEV